MQKQKKSALVIWIIILAIINVCLFMIYSIFLHDLVESIFYFNLINERIFLSPAVDGESIVIAFNLVVLLIIYGLAKLTYSIFKKNTKTEESDIMKKTGKLLIISVPIFAIVITAIYCFVNLNAQIKAGKSFISVEDKYLSVDLNRKLYNDGIINFYLPESFSPVNSINTELTADSLFTDGKYLVKLDRLDYNAKCVAKESKGISGNLQSESRFGFNYPFRAPFLAEDGSINCAGYNLEIINISGWRSLVKFESPKETILQSLKTVYIGS